MSMFWGYRGYSGGAASAATEASAAAAGARSQAREAGDAARDVQDRLDRLTLISMAMWELIREKTDLTEADLLAKVQDLDLRDGVVDGKITRSIKTCPSCGRTMSPRHKRCLYCGSEPSPETAFDQLT